MTMSGITQLIEGWHLQFGRILARGDGEIRMLAQQVGGLVGSDAEVERLLLEFAKQFENLPTVPHFRQFMGFLRRKQRAAREHEGIEKIRQTKCVLCAGARYVSLIAPWKDEGGGPVLRGVKYVPGEPWRGRGVLEEFYGGKCWCLDPEQHTYDSEIQPLKEQHRTWWIAAVRGEWALHPGELMDVAGAMNHYWERWRLQWWDVGDVGELHFKYRHEVPRPKPVLMNGDVPF